MSADFHTHTQTMDTWPSVSLFPGRTEGICDRQDGGWRKQLVLRTLPGNSVTSRMKSFQEKEARAERPEHTRRTSGCCPGRAHPPGTRRGGAVGGPPPLGAACLLLAPRRRPRSWQGSAARRELWKPGLCAHSGPAGAPVPWGVVGAGHRSAHCTLPLQHGRTDGRTGTLTLEPHGGRPQAVSQTVTPRIRKTTWHFEE